jgi:PIN domain nuclease of toxin-antitoxin system
VRLLLDTRVFLSLLHDDGRLSAATEAELADPGNAVYVSAASPRDIEIKRATGRLRAPVDVLGPLRDARLSLLSMTAEHGITAGRLPLHHRDPFDRMLVAQAQLEGLTIVTGDAKIAQYQVAILPA